MRITSSSSARLAIVISALIGCLLAAGAAHAATAVFYAEGNDVKRWNIGSSVTPTTVASTAGGSGYAVTGVFVDSHLGRVVWAGQKATNVLYVRAGDAGGTSQTGTEIYTDSNSEARGLAGDPTTSTLVWSSRGGTQGIYRSSYTTLTSTLSPSLVAINGLTAVSALGLTMSGSTVYYASENLTDSVQSASTAGGDATPIAPPSQTGVQAVALDTTGSAISFGGWMAAGTILSRSTSGTGAYTTVATGASQVAALATLSDDRVIWADGNQTTTVPDCSPNHVPAGSGCDLHLSDGSTIDLPGTTVGISSLWIVDSPTATAPPTVSGASAPGGTLSCSDATWAADLPGSRLSRQPTAARSYQWYLNGTAIGAATSSTYATPAAVYGTYGCRVTTSNTAGSGESSLGTTTFATLPDAPTAVTAATTAPGAAAVAWTAPGFDGYATITGYTATASPGGRTCATATTTCTITGLDSGTSYTFTVTSTNSAGTSTASAASSAVTTWSAPGAPTAVTAVRSGSGELGVSWNAPSSNGGSAVTSYTATATPGGKSCTDTDTSCRITGLTNGTSYTVTVTAANAVGTGVASSASDDVYPYASIAVTWKLSGRSLTATFRPVTGAKSYALSSTGATRKSGTCKTTGSGSKRRITCSLTLKKGTSTLTVKAKNTAKQVIAQATKSKTARRLTARRLTPHRR